jgi:hypothetical protein
MAAEMERWQAQAALTARAVVEAKHEVLERRREMEVTKDKMDGLVGHCCGRGAAGGLLLQPAQQQHCQAG